MRPIASLAALLICVTLTHAQTTQPIARDLPEWKKPIFGIYCGNSPEAVAKYEQWLGKETDAILGYTGDKDWKDYEGSVGWAMGMWAKTGRPVLWSVPIKPKDATLADCAAGKYNDHYRSIAKKLAAWRPEDPVIYIRTGWEFNGNWFHYRAAGQPENFIGTWKQFVDCFRAESHRFRFDWCPSGCDKLEMNAELAYPGDDYVDVIGLDVYDQFRYRKVKDPKERWEKIFLEGIHGLKWHRDFAKKHNKPIAFSEWGCGGNESGDNDYFIEQMYKWMIENKAVYANYWNSDSGYKGHMTSGEYPKIAAKYKELFGKP